MFPETIRGAAASNPLIKKNAETILDIDFSTLAAANAVNAENTGGYVIQVNKGNGEKVRFTNSGHDNTSALILLGDETIEKGNISVEILRLNKNLQLESTGLPKP